MPSFSFLKVRGGHPGFVLSLVGNSRLDIIDSFEQTLGGVSHKTLGNGNLSDRWTFVWPWEGRKISHGPSSWINGLLLLPVVASLFSDMTQVIQEGISIGTATDLVRFPVIHQYHLDFVFV